MSSTTPLDMSALEQARLIREGAISSAELVLQTLQRIRRLNPTYGAFVSVFEGAIAAARLGTFTAVLNLTGLPADSSPMGRTLTGLPMGLQIVGGPFAERDVLALSWELEEAMPWQTIAVRQPAPLMPLS